MSQDRVSITTPVGRIVMGSLYKPNTTDFDGKPLVIKTGQNAGQPRSQYFFGLAISKGAETHWALTEWGKQIWAVGHAAFPQAAQRPDFAWKIEDGDSAIPNKRNRKPVENEGWARHWILKFSGGFAPKIYRQEGNGYVQITEPDFVKPGYFVEVNFNTSGNENQSNPGIYLNHQLVCFRAYGQEIVFGPNVEEAGFGAAPLPAGASAVPLAGTIPLPGAPAASATVMPPPPASAPLPIPVVPNTAFLQVPPPATAAPTIPVVPGASPSSAPPPPPAVAAGPKMTAAAGVVTYQAYKTAGWSDEQLVAAGYMTL